jgi:hypothetical protein
VRASDGNHTGTFTLNGTNFNRILYGMTAKSLGHELSTLWDIYMERRLIYKHSVGTGTHASQKILAHKFPAAAFHFNTCLGGFSNALNFR